MPRRRVLPPRLCLACNVRKPAHEFAGPIARKCDACVTTRPLRVCQRCGESKPVDEFVKRGRCCATCRATPPPSAHCYQPRACFHCGVEKAPEAFDWGPGKGAFRKRRSVCRECIEREDAAKRQRMEQTRATYELDGVMVRRCSFCRLVKPLATGFYAWERDGDGNAISYQYDCRTCTIERVNERRRRLLRDENPDVAERERAKERERQRRWRRANPEKYREIKRGYLQRLRADPERHRRHLDNQRIARRLRAERKGRTLRAAPEPVERGGHDRLMLPSAPVAAAVRAWLARECPYGDQESGCAALGITDKTLREWEAGRRPTVTFRAVDRCLVGMGLLWWDVFTAPGDYEAARHAFEGDEAAAA